MESHKVACRPWWACMQFPELTWSFMSLHAVSRACMQFLSLSEQLTRISQCLFILIEFWQDQEEFRHEPELDNNMTIRIIIRLRIIFGQGMCRSPACRSSQMLGIHLIPWQSINTGTEWNEKEKRFMHYKTNQIQWWDWFGIIWLLFSFAPANSGSRQLQHSEAIEL